MVNDTLETKETKSPKRLKENKKPKRLKENENEKENKKGSRKAKKLPKGISQEILKKIFANLLRAVGIMLYFIILNLAHSTMKEERLVGDIEVFSGMFLIVGIYFLERAYQKEQGGIVITAIELLVLSLHSLSIMHIITLFKYDFRFYLLTSSYIFSIYYVSKAIVLYTKGRREYLKSLSDISEIVKKEEPVKKEAQKRTKQKAKTEKTQTKKKKTIEPTKAKKTTNVKAKLEKEEEKKQEETKEPEKKKRGRPKKEVMKND